MNLAQTCTTIGLLFVFIASNSFANSLVKTEVIADNLVPPNGFGTADAAAVAATDRYNPDSISENREHVGGIIACPESRHYYTHGVGKSDESPVRFSVSSQPGCELVALWHTHGGRAHNRRYFSSFDTRTVQITGKPFYMSDYRGALRVFSPGDPTFVNKMMRKSLTKLPDGSASGRRVRDARGKSIHVANR